MAAVALAGAGGAAFLAYRKQLTEEQRQAVAEKQHALQEAQHDEAGFTELRDRFAVAAEQLGHDKAAVRLAGVYSMADLADDWARREEFGQLQVCVDVLCAYLRMTSADDPSAEEQQVRESIVSILGQRFRRSTPDVSWSGVDINLAGARLHGAFFRGAVFAGTVNFTDAVFEGSVDFAESLFDTSRALFGGVTFKGEADFRGCQIIDGLISFASSEFQAGADFSEMSCRRSNFELHGATFGGRSTSFRGAHISPPDLPLNWRLARFESKSCTFERSSFVGPGLDMTECTFAADEVSFESATFQLRSALFARSKFTGRWVGFELANFECRRVIFDESEFTGAAVSFVGAIFGDRCNFSLDHCSIAGASIRFSGAVFPGGEIHLQDVFLGPTGGVDLSEVEILNATVVPEPPAGFIPASG